MVNYRRVLCEVALLSAFVMLASSAPASDYAVHYDQRQNGTENYRIKVDGLVFAVVPAEPLFSALGDIDDLMELLSLEDFNADLKPKPPQTSTPSNIFESVALATQGSSLSKPQEKPTEEKPLEEKPLEFKPQEGKPEETKPQETKPQQTKPEEPTKPAEPSPLSDVSLNDDFNIQKKEVSPKKQEKVKRLKNRLASFLLPLVRRSRHQ